ncbi:MAG: hypothetical protein DCF18_14070 [Cyanobium sp.]|nr:MAG: hypothetical protein DCF18_14070 [Cyanobium sp.]
MQGTSPGELIPELMRQAFQDLNDLEVAVVLGAERVQRYTSIPMTDSNGMQRVVQAVKPCLERS